MSSAGTPGMLNEEASTPTAASGAANASGNVPHFGRYKVLGLLGQGGMARVYLVVASGPVGVNKLLVIKELRGELASDPSAREMFLNEARIATRLNHPNVVQTQDVVQDGETMYLTMEYLQGLPLQTILRSAHGDPIGQLLVLQMLADMLSGLHYVHELRDYDGKPLGLVHRDVSPHNVFVTYDGLVKLVDFGIAKAADASNNTATGIFKGKVRYAAPEQVTNTNVDRRADIFAVGTMVWEIAAGGKRLWSDLKDLAILTKLARREIPSIREVAPNAHPDLVRIAERALSSDANDRYPTAEALRADLLAFIEASSTHGKVPDLATWMRSTFAKQHAEAREFVDSRMQMLRESALIAIPEYTGSTTAVVATSSGAIERPKEDVSPAKRRGLGLGLGLGLAAVAVVVIGLVARTKPSTSAPIAAAPPTAEPTPAPVPPGSAHITVRATPVGAQVLLDGAPIGTTPLDTMFPHDSKAHVLVVAAKGYEERKVDVTFDHDVSLELDLHTLAAAPTPPAPAPTTPRMATVRAPAAPPAPSLSSAPPPPPSTRTHKKTPPGRIIDEENPYQR